MVKFVCGPEDLLMSSRPTVFAIFPAPSASKLPAMPTGPLASKPCRRKAYWPLSRASFPVPQVPVKGISAEADFVVSATAVAMIVTIAGAGILAGGVLATGSPLAVFAGLIVPHEGEHAVPLCVRVQETPLLLTSFVTVAVKGWVLFTLTLAVVGATETVTPLMAAVAVAEAVVSATEVATMVTSA